MSKIRNFRTLHLNFFFWQRERKRKIKWIRLTLWNIIPCHGDALCSTYFSIFTRCGASSANGQWRWSKEKYRKGICTKQSCKCLHCFLTVLTFAQSMKWLRLPCRWPTTVHCKSHGQHVSFIKCIIRFTINCVTECDGKGMWKRELHVPAVDKLGKVTLSHLFAPWSIQ